MNIILQITLLFFLYGKKEYIDFNSQSAINDFDSGVSLLSVLLYGLQRAR